MERAQPSFASKLKGLFQRDNTPRPAPKKSLNPFAGYFDQRKKAAHKMKLLLERFPGLKNVVFKSDRCETCRGPLGIVHPGQHKRFCADHNRKGRLERCRAAIARFA